MLPHVNVYSAVPGIELMIPAGPSLWLSALGHTAVGRKRHTKQPGQAVDSGVRRGSVNSLMLFLSQKAENPNCFHFPLLKVTFRTVMNMVISKPSSQIK